MAVSGWAFGGIYSALAQAFSLNVIITFVAVI
jgi:hypothetical protein